MPPLLSRLHGPDRGTARLSHSHAKSPANVTIGCYNQATNTIVAIIKGECESSHSDGGVSIVEPPTSAMEQVLLSWNFMYLHVVHPTSVFLTLFTLYLLYVIQTNFCSRQRRPSGRDHWKRSVSLYPERKTFYAITAIINTMNLQKRCQMSLLL